eukprot:5499818-Amphidinium_carterae.1
MVHSGKVCDCTMNPDSDYLDNSTFQFDMVAEHLQSDMEFDMVAELAFTMGETTERDIEKNNDIEEENKENKNKMYNNEDKHIDKYNKNEEEMQTLSMKMNIKSPSPTQFDGRYIFC